MRINFTKTLTALFLFFLFSGSSLMAQSQLCMGIGGNADDAGYAIVQTADSGYVIAGDTKSFGAGGSDVYVVKLNKAGTIVWTRTVGGATNDFARSMIQTTDGGFAISGYTNSFGAGGNDVYVIKLDASGTVQWTRTAGGIRDEIGWQIIQTSDGGFAIGGQSTSFSTGINDMYLLKLDSAGNKKWDSRVTRGNIAVMGYALAQAPDGGYVLCGTTPGKIPSGMYSPDWYVVKLDSANRAMVWNRYIVPYPGKDYYTQPTSVINTADGGFMVTGYASQPKGGGYTHDMYALKLNGNGTISWTSFYGGIGTGSGNNDDQVKSVIQTADGGYVLAGFSRSFGALYIGSQTIYVVKIDGNGSMLWNRVIGTKTADGANCIVQTFDGGYAMTGFTLYPSGTTQNMSLVKLDASAGSACCEGSGGAPSFITPSTGTIGSSAAASATLVLNAGSSGTGGTVTLNNCGTVIPPPIAAFQADDSTICSNDCINFFDQSSYAISWKWSFPGGNPSSSSLANPTVCYPTSGDYDVIFRVYGSNGDSDVVTKSNLIHVVTAPPTPVITRSNDTLYCLEDPSYVSYQWYDGATLVNGATNSHFVFTHDGNYNVSVISANGCAVAVGINVITGLEPVTVEGLGFTISPNPVADLLYINAASFSGKSRITIFNVLGEIILTKVIHSKQETVNCKAFSSGIYKIRIENEHGLATGTFVKE